jgi:hypothetical protein
MRARFLLLLVLSSTALSADNVHFFGTWEPRPMLREFWRPVSESWWSCNARNECGPGPRLRKRCVEFAGAHSPEVAIPELIADLRIYASEANEFVYLCIMGHWPRSRVLRTLESLRHSRDPATSSLAEQTLEDVRETNE